MITYTATIYAHWVDGYLTYTIQAYTDNMAWLLAADHNIAEHDEGVLLFLEQGDRTIYGLDL